ncbi:MAG: hypothetical protein ACYCUD_13535 [Candidatus Dormibacteria bacterium]
MITLAVLGAPRYGPGFGFAGIVVAADNASFVYSHALFAANAYDVPVSVRLVELMKAHGHAITELIADRGFSHDSGWLNALRREDVMPVFDLKSPQMKLFPTWRGCLMLPSGVYLPTLPERLWLIERPGLQAPADKTEAYSGALPSGRRSTPSAPTWSGASRCSRTPT